MGVSGLGGEDWGSGWMALTALALKTESECRRSPRKRDQGVEDGSTGKCTRSPANPRACAVAHRSPGGLSDEDARDAFQGFGACAGPSSRRIQPFPSWGRDKVMIKFGAPSKNCASERSGCKVQKKSVYSSLPGSGLSGWSALLAQPSRRTPTRAPPAKWRGLARLALRLGEAGRRW